MLPSRLWHLLFLLLLLLLGHVFRPCLRLLLLPQLLQCVLLLLLLLHRS